MKRENMAHRIILVPQGGLANRMRAIASGLVLARAVRREMTVIWHKNSELNAPFNLIFNTENLPFTLLETGGAAYRVCYETPRKKNFYLSKIYSFLTKSEILHIDNEIDFENLKKTISNHNGNFIINSGLQFAEFDHNLFSGIFRFSEKIEFTKNKILNRETPKVAIQIRRTDNSESISNSPVELFEDVVIKMCKDNPEKKIFLATDDNDIKSYFARKYPSNIIVNPRKANRNSPEGIVDAAAEFLTMSQCEVIYGSFWSSFSEMAAVYGDAKLIIVKR